MTKKIIETKEDDAGIWDKVVYEGCVEAVWIKREQDSWKQALRMPIGCHACGKFMTNWDTSFFNRHGVCSECFVNYLDGRDLPDLKRSEDKIAYCKSQVKEKQQKLEDLNS